MAAAQGVRAALREALRIKGLLEMAHENLADWVAAFIEDVETLVPPLD